MRQHHSFTRQRGAALVVGLLLLVVLTLLAISGMNTASLELIMAGNETYRQNAFQAAETGIEQALQSGTFDPNDSFDADDDISDTDSYRYEITAPINHALGGFPGASADKYSTFHFEIESAGAAARNAASTHVQGVAIIAPADATFPPLNPADPDLE